VFDRRTGEIDKIGRDQGQHARREKADQTGNQRRRDRDILNHVVIAIFLSHSSFWPKALVSDLKKHAPGYDPMGV
jgi:hypothetical protein